MKNYCSNCGNKIEENQNVCLGCGVFIDEKIAIKNNKKDYKTYKTISGIVMIVLGLLLLAASSAYNYEYSITTFAIPGLLGIISGVLNLLSKKEENLLLISAIILFVAAIINVVSISDISIYATIAVVFGIFNLIYMKRT